MKSDKQEWQLWIENGEIFVKHLILPCFLTQIIIEGNHPNIRVSFKTKWQDSKQGGLDWHFKALEFYNHAIMHAPRFNS